MKYSNGKTDITVLFRSNRFVYIIYTKYEYRLLTKPSMVYKQYVVDFEQDSLKARFCEV